MNVGSRTFLQHAPARKNMFFRTKEILVCTPFTFYIEVGVGGALLKEMNARLQ